MPDVKGKVEGKAPAEPNAFSDGSLKNTKGLFWGVGGAGVWWPGRAANTLSEEEKQYTEYKEEKSQKSIFNPEGPSEEGGGMMLWCPFNSRLNSSTRTELGAAILTLLAPITAHIGIDNAAVVQTGSQIINHLRRRAKER